MANRLFRSQYLYGFNANPVLLEGRFNVGAAGAVSSLKGSGINSVTRLGTGTYLIDLSDDYNRLLDMKAFFIAPTTGAAVAAGAFVVGTTYRITSLGTTIFSAVGLPSAFTQAVGQTFVATGVGAGTGTATAVGDSGIASVEVADANVDQSVNLKVGVMVQCLSDAGAAADPANGSVMCFSLLLRNSSLKGKGE